MKWFNVQSHNPPSDGYYIVRIKSDEEESGEIIYAGHWFEDGNWIQFDDIVGIITHFIIPDAIENGDYYVPEIST